MMWMRIVVLTVSIISVTVLITLPRGSAIVKSQPGCPSNGSAFQVDYFGFPLKGYWKCEITQEFTQGGSATLYKAGSIYKVAVDAAFGLAVILVPTLFVTRRTSK